MMRSPAGRTLATALVAGILPLFLLGCPKKPPPEQPDAAVAPPVEDAGTLQITTSDDDAATDAGPDAAKKYTGPGMNPNEAKVERCCAHLRQMFAAIPGGANAPEAKSAIAQCESIRTQVKANPNAPEIAQLKALPGCM
jgi:predicted small lipoprotein YifL